jgi:hypothetical protein
MSTAIIVIKVRIWFRPVIWCGLQTVITRGSPRAGEGIRWIGFASLVISRTRHTFGTQLMYFVDLPQDCLETRFDGFAEWRKPDRPSASEQGTSEFMLQSPNCI